MVFPRPTSLRGFASRRLLHSTVRPTVRSRVQSVARRTYASEGGHAHAPPSSDLPWLISAVAVTVPSCWFLWPDSSHADAHHGDHDHHEHEETAEEHGEDSEEHDEKIEDSKDSARLQGTETLPQDEQAEAQTLPEEDKDPQKGSNVEEESSDESKDEPKDDSKDDSKDDGGEDDKDTEGKPDKTEPEKHGSDKEVPGVQFKGKTSKGDENNEMTDTRKREPDNKGAFKKRIDSGYQKNLGEGPHKDENKKPVGASAKELSGHEGAMDTKQKGVSNTPTRHSTAIDQDPEKSKKGEGIPETAKAMNTVPVDRPVR